MKLIKLILCYFGIHRPKEYEIPTTHQGRPSTYTVEYCIWCNKRLAKDWLMK